MLRKRNKGQTSLEYSVLFIVVVGALLATQDYMKRGIQGRWKESIDEMGDQYDPKTAISDMRHNLDSTTTTNITAIEDAGGYWTQRLDNTTSSETKTGTTTLGAY